VSAVQKNLLRVALAALLLGGCAGPMSKTGGAGVISDQRPDAMQPRRVGPAAMEAWIAPWESGAGDLYPAATVYISVAPERWEYAPTDGPSVLRPIQLDARIEEATRAPATPQQPAAFMPTTGPSQPAIPIPDGIRRET
jgi:hypothetical protein